MKKYKSYDDITILKYQEIHEAKLLSDGNMLTEWVNVLNLLTDIPADNYRAMTILELNEAAKEYAWLKDLPTKWPTEFECQGEKFIVTLQLVDWNAEQFVSMSNLLADKSKLIDNMHYIMAIMCPKYKREIVPTAEMERRANLFQDHLSYGIAYPCALFFLSVMAQLAKNTRFCSIMSKMDLMPKKILQAKKTGFMKSGVGI